MHEASARSSRSRFPAGPKIPYPLAQLQHPGMDQSGTINRVQEHRQDVYQVDYKSFAVNLTAVLADVDLQQACGKRYVTKRFQLRIEEVVILDYRRLFYLMPQAL